MRRCENDPLAIELGRRRGDYSAAIGKQRGREGDGGVERLADEEVAVVKGRSQDRYLDFSLRRSALLYIGKFKAAEGTLVAIGVGGGGGWFSRVVNNTGLPFRLGDTECERHG
jgi:hypothetical protein